MEDPYEVIESKRGGYRLIDPNLIGEEDISVVKNDNSRVMSHPFFDFYPDEFTILADGKRTSLTTAEKEILETLLASPNHVDSKETLTQDSSYPTGAKRYTGHSFRSHISRLREKIKAGREDLSSREIIQAVQGAGYRLVLE